MRSSLHYAEPEQPIFTQPTQVQCHKSQSSNVRVLDAHPSNALTCQMDGGRDFYLFTNFGKSKLGVTNADTDHPARPIV